MRVYLIGGAVRDQLMGRTPQDLDYVVFDASEAEVMERFSISAKVGKRIPAYVTRGAEYTISQAPDIHAELQRRDLTINALARDEDGRIIAAPGGLEDLENNILRPVSDENFFQDPLRVHRAARFWARLPDHTPSEELLSLMQRVSAAGALSLPAAERVGQETLKACASARPGNFLRLLARTGALAPWFAELAEASRIPAGPPQFHEHDVLEHTAQVMDRAAPAAAAFETEQALLGWMALCHDLGKTRTAPELWPKHHGHDTMGESLALALGSRLKLPNRYIRAGCIAARRHMLAAQYATLRPGTRVKLLLELKSRPMLTALAALVWMDQGAKGEPPGAVDTGAARTMRRDLKTILSVKLPKEKQNLGKASGVALRDLQCMALSRAHAEE